MRQTEPVIALDAAVVSSGLSAPSVEGARAVAVPERCDATPERLLFGKSWLDGSGLTFARNDMFEVQAYRQVGKLSHVFPLESVPVLIDGRSNKRFSEMLGLVPEALNYVSSLTVGQAFPQPMRTRRVPEAPRHRFEEALSVSRMIVAATGVKGRAMFLDALSPTGAGLNQDLLERRLVGTPPEQARFVLSEIQAMRDAIMAHAGIVHAVAFRASWERVGERVEDLHKALASNLRWFNGMLSYSVGFLREIVGAPIERLAAQSDLAHAELRNALSDGDVARVPERQFTIWRECRRVTSFFGPVATLWDVIDFNGAPRMNVEALVRSTVCRLQSFR